MGGENGNEGDKKDASLFLLSFLELSHFNGAAILYHLLRKQTCLPMSQLGCLTLHTSFLSPSEKKRNSRRNFSAKKISKTGKRTGAIFPTSVFSSLSWCSRFVDRRALLWSIKQSRKILEAIDGAGDRKSVFAFLPT